MTNVFTLDDLDAAIEKEYAPMRFSAGGEEFILRSLIRVGANDRKAVIAKLEKLETSEENEEEILETTQFVFRTVCADGKGDKLIDVLGDDVVRYMKLLALWVEATQPGEAQPSQN